MSARMRARVSLLAAASGATFLALFAACSSGGNGNPAPTIRDSGTDSSRKPDGAVADTGTGHDAGHDGTTTTKDGAAGKLDAGVRDAIAIPDVSLDVGSCRSDSGACNSCYTDAQAATNRYNACSAYTKNCVKFTTTVPAHPTL